MWLPRESLRTVKQTELSDIDCGAVSISIKRPTICLGKVRHDCCGRSYRIADGLGC